MSAAFQELWSKAVSAGIAAGEAAIPTPMIVAEGDVKLPATAAATSIVPVARLNPALPRFPEAVPFTQITARDRVSALA